jgi:hypothetical protein
VEGKRPRFVLADMNRISPEMVDWLRERLKFPEVA